MIDSEEEGNALQSYSNSGKIEQGSLGSNGIEFSGERSQEYTEKLTIILSIKVTEMMKKINLLLAGTNPNEDGSKSVNLFSTFEHLTLSSIPYDIFRKGVLALLKRMEQEFLRSKLTMSEEDIKSIFSILDEGERREISRESLQLLLDESAMARKITRFYENRVNRKMVKNTLFKLGKNSNSIQIYQVKSASVL